MVVTTKEQATPATTASPLTLSDLVTRFCARRSLARKTRIYYSNILTKFAWYAGAQDWPDLAEITQEHIRGFLSYVATEEVRWPEARRTATKAAAQATVHHYGKVVKSLFGWTESLELAVAAPSGQAVFSKSLGNPRHSLGTD